MYHVTVLTLFPELFPGTLGGSIPQKALEKNIWTLDTINIRDFAKDKHNTVDDTPYGGGAGMVIRPDVVHGALEKAYQQNPDRHIIYMSPRGETLTQKKLHSNIQNYPKGSIILCGRYEGIDQRVIDYWSSNHQLEEISIGDYILSGGEIAAQVYLDALIRLLPNALGNKFSALEESFELDLLEFFHYTKPYEWNGVSVPDVLLSGHHKHIEQWRHNQSQEITKKKRPDLWKKFSEKKST